jgi:murein DD-endopeptidase MepM/ murein hydrolase activator NlpD
MKAYYILLLFIFSCQQPNARLTKRLTEKEVFFQAQKYVRWFNSYELDSLINCIVDQNFTIKDLENFREDVTLQLGTEVKLLNETFGTFLFENRLVYGYSRYSEYSKTDRPVQTVFGFDTNDNIYRFEIKSLPNEASTKYLDYQTKTELRLPFEGEWCVVAGGRSINYNHHTVASDQRFAYDFLIKKDGYSYHKFGLQNEDYYCYNKKVLAPGKGIIVDIVNNIKENKLGEMPKISGNRLIIDHENGEYSILSHFKYNSIVVKLGDTVTVGQFLGLCGNSGHSSEPHIHYHLQNSAEMFNGEGLPAQFISYISDSVYMKIGEPFWNQKIQNK